MDPNVENALRHADRESLPVRLTFHDGTTALARIRDVDWDRHRVLTFIDMDNACRAATVDLDHIAAVQPA